MKKIVTHVTLTIFALFALYAPIICSEQNWLQTKISTITKNMLERSTYRYNSLEHYRDRVILYSLPAIYSHYILEQQRNNMKKFLKENEANALEGVRQNLDLDQEEWSTAMNTAKKEHEFNLSEMRKERDFNTYHDPSLLPEWVNRLEHESKRHKINSNSLNFDTTNRETAFAETRSPRPDSQLITYNPGTISLNPIFSPTRDQTIKVAAHEMLHVIAGHTLIGENINGVIIKPQIMETLNNRIIQLKDQLHQIESSGSNFMEKITELSKATALLETDIENEFIRLQQANQYLKEFKNSSAHANLVAAQEKTADTLIACTDPEIARSAAYCAHYPQVTLTTGQITTEGYPDNYNDILVIGNNWQMAQRIASSDNFFKSSRKKLQDFWPTINF